MPHSGGPRITTPEVIVKIRPRRPVEGISAVYLSRTANGALDFDSFAENILRTASAGLTPAVNVEFGYVEKLSHAERKRALDVASDVLVTRTFVAGAYVDGKGDVKTQYKDAVWEIVRGGAIPLLMPSEKLNALPPDELVKVHQSLADEGEGLIAYEADPLLVAGGKIYSAEVVREIMGIPKIVGLRHASLNRRLEWERLSLRDYVRPDFKIYSGNEIALDMMTYGSDYFLGVSSMVPEAFVLRDRYWRDGDSRFYELNDVLQSLGMLAFRPPFGAARHSAAQMLKLRGRIDQDSTAPGDPERPDSDKEILAKILDRLEMLLHAGHIYS